MKLVFCWFREGGRWLFGQWAPLFKGFKKYFNSYGGLSAIFRSPYFQASLLLTIFLDGWWSDMSSKWFEYPEQIIPSLLGLTLSGYAIWLGVSDDEFRKRLASHKPKGSDESLFVILNASYVHFIIVQAVALMFSLGCHEIIKLEGGFWVESVRYIYFGLSFLLFIYSIFLTLTIVMTLFRYSTWYDKWLNRNNVKK